jgi:DNA adenine methylase
MNKSIPRPFVKWVGGKSQLLDQYESYFPKDGFSGYIEPFVGGGAVFFHLLPKNSVLIDINEELINCYRVIKDHVEDLIEDLKKHRYTKKYFYEIRDLDRNPGQYEKLSDVERASRTIFLNKTCYNGLYRVNSRGEFNAPFGRYTNPRILDELNLREVNKVLENVIILCDDFSKCLDWVEPDSFVYLDSPYMPLTTKSANFTSYTPDKFTKIDQLRLFGVFKKLDWLGAKVMQSNSNNKLIIDLYKDFKIEYINARRNINSNSNKRGEIKELLILNY